MFILALLIGGSLWLVTQFISLYLPMQYGSIKLRRGIWNTLSIIAFIYGFYLGYTI